MAFQNIPPETKVKDSLAILLANDKAAYELAVKAGVDHYGPEPPEKTWPGMTWANSAEKLRLRRSDDDTTWIIEGRLFHATLDQVPADEVPDTNQGPIYVPGTGIMEWDDEVGAYVAQAAGATGGGSDQVFYLNQQVVTRDFVIPEGMNAGSFGDVSIAPGATVTVSPGSTWDMRPTTPVRYLATDWAGDEPPPVTWPFMTWAHVSANLLKRRNADNTDWIVVDYLIMSMEDRRWASLPVGFHVAIRDDLAGMPIPPIGNPHFRYIKLTAADPYNEGVLVDELVTGSGNDVTATAAVSLEGSPIDGQLVRLINTERLFLRAGESGVRQGQSLQAHSHSGTTNTGGYHDHAIGGGQGLAREANGTGSWELSTSGARMINAMSILASGQHQHSFTTDQTGGDENRPRNLGITYYLRVK